MCTCGHIDKFLYKLTFYELPLSTYNYATMQVLWVGRDEVSASWVGANCVPAEIISDYESQRAMEVHIEKLSQNGQSLYTASVIEQSQSKQVKRMKLDRWLTPATSGYNNDKPNANTLYHSTQVSEVYTR